MTHNMSVEVNKKKTSQNNNLTKKVVKNKLSQQENKLINIQQKKEQRKMHWDQIKIMGTT